MLPYGAHSIEQDDIDAVVDVLKNQFLTQGKQVPAFENALCNYTSAEYALAVNSATSALHVACLSLGVTKGDIVWTTPNTFVASANCALYCGADIDFVDIDPDTRNLSPSLLEAKLEKAKANRSLPKVVIVVHFAGLSCEMDEFRRLSTEYDFYIIEDASHALGASYKGSRVGCCSNSDITIFSFHPVKPITTAEGGALLTNNKDIFDKALLHAKHGVTRASELIEDEFQAESDGNWYYQQVELGFNYRLSDIHAALGVSQLTKVNAFTEQRQQLALYYNEQLAALPVKVLSKQQIKTSACHIYVVELQQHDRLAVYNKMIEQEIGCNVHYIPVHLQPFYQKLGFKKGDFVNAETYYQNALTLPLFPAMTFQDVDTVVEALKGALL